MYIGLDVMGGDRCPSAPLEGANLWGLEQKADQQLILLGNKDILNAEISKLDKVLMKYEIVHAPEVITMSDHAAKAIVAKPNSSISMGLQMLKEKKLDAFISAGHSGAMLAGAVILLGCIDGVDRPTVAAIFPGAGDRCLVCDAGANTECKPENLVQFARLTSLFYQFVWKKKNPRIGLLNIGEEKSKGTPSIIQTYHLLENQGDINFVGNLQGWDLNKNKADIYVTDGFTGNILLKYGESMYDIFQPKLPNDPLIEQFNYESVGGLPFLGVRGNVILGHGVSGPVAFKNMIKSAIDVVNSDLVTRIEEAFKS